MTLSCIADFSIYKVFFNNIFIEKEFIISNVIWTIAVKGPLNFFFFTFIACIAFYIIILVTSFYFSLKTVSQSTTIIACTILCIVTFICGVSCAAASHFLFYSFLSILLYLVLLVFHGTTFAVSVNTFTAFNHLLARVLNISGPKTTDQLRYFLEIINFSRRSIINAAEIQLNYKYHNVKRISPSGRAGSRP